jgi:ubiquinone/menaquinone biosynthesis C-methylase UbiE
MQRICPWWLTYTFDNPLRKLFQDPYKILSPYIHPGMCVGDVGCGMGYFTIPIAKLAGEAGYVQAVDVQHQQLKKVEKRAKKAGVLARIERTLAEENSLHLKPALDFILAFAVVHEIPSIEIFFREISESLKLGGKLLVAEPSHHVSKKAFAKELEMARQCGLKQIPDPPVIKLSLCALLEKT